jgi:hypothetical protein
MHSLTEEALFVTEQRENALMPSPTEEVSFGTGSAADAALSSGMARQLSLQDTMRGYVDATMTAYKRGEQPAVLMERHHAVFRRHPKTEEKNAPSRDLE